MSIVTGKETGPQRVSGKGSELAFPPFRAAERADITP
jgi:hypothetical protein